MLELVLDVLVASLFIYVYFQQAQETQAPQAQQEVEVDGTVMRGEWGAVYDSFWYGDDDVDYDVDDWCTTCNEDAGYYEYVTAYRHGEMETDEDCIDWDYGKLDTAEYTENGMNVLYTKSIRELKRLASQAKIKNYGSLTKAQLQDALISA